MECAYFRSERVMTLADCERDMPEQIARFRHHARQLAEIGIVDGFCDPASELL